jgi:hypothetical protein
MDSQSQTADGQADASDVLAAVRHPDDFDSAPPDDIFDRLPVPDDPEPEPVDLFGTTPTAIAATAAPQWLDVQTDGIPAELKPLPQFVCWAYERRADDEGPTKIPYTPDGKRWAKANDATTWGRFQEALATYNRRRNKFAGIGFEFAAGGGIVGIDLDDCRDQKTGELKRWAIDAIGRFNSYAEISPSGTGVKIWCRGKIQCDGTGKKRAYHDGAVEMYGRGRFFAMTGHRFESAPSTVNEAQAAIDWLWAAVFAEPKRPERNGHTAARDDDRIIDRARKYVATMDIAIQGQRGSDDAMDVACVLVLGFDLTPEQAYPLFVEYSGKCKPPWSEREIWHKLKSADAKAGERGYLRDAQRNGHVAPATHPGAGQASRPQERVEYQLITCRELDAADYDLEYLIDHMLVARQPCVFAGGKKCLKTSLLIDLAIALATGTPFVDRFQIRRAARVLLMTGESGLATIQETARRISAAKGLALSEVAGLIFSPQLPLFGHLLHMDAVAETLAANQIEVLVVDPAYLAMPTDGNESSLFAMGALLRGIADVCQKAGVTFILAHHTRKTLTDPYAPPELEDIAWAGFNEFARQWVLVGRRERYEPGSGQHRLWLNAGGSAGHSSCWALDISEGAYDGRTPRTWQVSLLRAEEARQDAEQRQESAKVEKASTKQTMKVEAATKKLVQAAVKYPNGETKRTLFDTAGLSNALGNLALAAAIDAKAMVACEVTKGKQRAPREGYKLRPDGE